MGYQYNELISEEDLAERVRIPQYSTPNNIDD